MAAQPVLTFHDGRLDIPKELQADLDLREGSKLRVVSCSPGHLTLAVADCSCPDVGQMMKLLDSLRGILPDRRTPEWDAAAVDRKEKAAKELDRLHASGAATGTELKHAEREWELADDELDFGPFAQS